MPQQEDQRSAEGEKLPQQDPADKGIEPATLQYTMCMLYNWTPYAVVVLWEHLTVLCFSVADAQPTTRGSARMVAR